METSSGVRAEQVRTRPRTANADEARSISESDVAGASWTGEVAGGIAGAISSLALVLSFGILAFAPLGIEHAGVGVTAGFASAMYGQLIAGLAGGTVHPGSGPRAAATLLLFGLVAALVADPALAPSATQGPGRIVALAGACVVASGLLQIVLAWLRAGQFARYVPCPFVAGFLPRVLPAIAATAAPAIPIAVLAGTIIATSVGLVDRWVRGFVMMLPQDAERRDPSRVLSLATVVIVATVTVASWVSFPRWSSGSRSRCCF